MRAIVILKGRNLVTAKAYWKDISKLLAAAMSYAAMILMHYCPARERLASAPYYGFVQVQYGRCNKMWWTAKA